MSAPRSLSVLARHLGSILVCRLDPVLALAPALLLAGAVAARASYEGFFPDSEDGGSKPLPAESNGREVSCPTVWAYAIDGDGGIKVDGRLDDEVWRKAEIASGFSEWDPDRGAPPSEQTSFKVAYDEHAIYFAVACAEKDPSQISQSLSRRDRFTNTDYVSIFIDPYHDKSTGYNFRVNPLGVQEDSYVYNDGDTDTDWDGVWKAETSEDQDGWYAEIRIPFASIRYRPTTSTWGLQVRRYLQSRGEDTSWSVWDRDTPGFVSRFGQVRGLDHLSTPRQLEAIPYVVARATDPAVAGPEKIDDFENFGLDLKYGVTADLSLNATFQPDFGQVEADPAVLNLSPFETFYDEKRPFFIEGSRFFEHQDFNLFYSRRIGTGDENSRIRYAAKLTGKTAQDVSVAALFASTDVTGNGQSQNFLKDGKQLSRYFVGRFGKEFAEGRFRFNVTQTAAFRSASRDTYGDLASREAYTSGADFRLQFHDRAYQVDGSVVGSVIDPEGLKSDPSFRPSRKYGTGGEFSVQRNGELGAGTWFRWESDRLDLNDLGFLSAPDEMGSGGWVSYQYTPDGKSTWLNTTSLNLNFYKNWLYGDRTGFDLHTGQPIWHYSSGHRSFSGGNVNGWMQFRNFREAWWGLEYVPRSTQRYETRSDVLLADGSRVSLAGGGPLIDEPATYGAWVGVLSDSRKDLVLRLEANHYRDTVPNRSTNLQLGLEWNQSGAIHHEIAAAFRSRIDDTQHLDNFENPDGAIGGVSFVFAGIDQRTLDLTLRSQLIFSKNQSLELYAQPFITVGSYTDAKELAIPDSYIFRPYTRNGFRAADRDFSYSSVNLNAVYRWEYRPGSTFFLVWTHSRSTYQERRFSANPRGFDNGLTGGALFNNEPENTILAKITYWIPI